MEAYSTALQGGPGAARAASGSLPRRPSDAPLYRIIGFLLFAFALIAAAICGAASFMMERGDF